MLGVMWEIIWKQGKGVLFLPSVLKEQRLQFQLAVHPKHRDSSHSVLPLLYLSTNQKTSVEWVLIQLVFLDCL